MEPQRQRIERAEIVEELRTGAAGAEVMARVWVAGVSEPLTRTVLLAPSQSLATFQYVDELVAPPPTQAIAAGGSRRRSVWSRAWALLRRAFDEPTRDDRALQAFGDILGYKVVQFRIEQNQAAPVGAEWAAAVESSAIAVRDVRVLLVLQIPGDRATIYRIENGSGPVPPADLNAEEKYCTDRARTIGARILGGSDDAVRAALVLYQAGLGYFGSDHDRGATRWTLDGGETLEPQAGHECGMGRCGRGLYFYVDEDKAVRVWGSGVGATSPSGEQVNVYVTKRLSSRRGLVVRTRTASDDLDDDEAGAWNKASHAEQRAYRLGILRNWADRIRARHASMLALEAAEEPEPAAPPALNLFLDDLPPMPTLPPSWPSPVPAAGGPVPAPTDE